MHPILRGSIAAFEGQIEPEQKKKYRKIEQKMLEISAFVMLDGVFGLFSCSMNVVQESVLQCNTRVIGRDACTEKEKALRVPRAVNIG